jgi:hypothetical protein
MLRGEVQIQLKPGGYRQTLSGENYGTIRVDRIVIDGGLLNQNICWTDLDREDDETRYVGPEGERGQPVTREIIGSWLLRDGPKQAW